VVAMDAAMATTVVAVAVAAIKGRRRSSASSATMRAMCYKHFNSTFTGTLENKSASSATVSYGVNTN
jgi:hypothetical protein